MKTDTPQTIFLKDYREPDYWVETVDLRVELGEENTTVESTLKLIRREGADTSAELVLDGQDMELLSISIDGEALDDESYTVAPETLTVRDVPASCVLVTKVAIKPQENTSLEGLYKASGIFCTQCEAEGFRKITYYLDRPDVMASFSTTIVADASKYPVMLSNGNPVEEGTLEDGRRWVKWVDPFKKPAYLFALVAGDLRSIEDTYTTTSGREVKLEIFVEPENITKCDHAMESLKQSMKWDEDTYGLEYDLDIYMIVAVNDFNMGAMENKGLNVFNSKYVLARQDTATDDDYEGIQGVIGHEYFHNWSGNRVTCRDWFQLSLKEGLTVFRDQEFSSDMNSRAVKRIQDVDLLRTYQFPEDGGPMSHPVRPASYIEINNFYTRTVYEKGSEVVRMIHTLVGNDGFRKGMDLYFERHDGQAVTCDDFAKAMEDANGVDLTQFRRWYSQSGTPELEVALEFDANAKTCTLDVKQSCPSTPGQDTKEPYHMPLKMGLVAEDGSSLQLKLQGRDEALGEEHVLELREAQEKFVFEGIESRPIPSLLRGFSAPVRLIYEYTDVELATLLAHDQDSFTRREAGQLLAMRVMQELIADHQAGRPLSSAAGLVESFRTLLNAEGFDKALLAESLRLPGEAYVAEQMEVVDVDAIFAAREAMRREIGTALRTEFLGLFDSLGENGDYVFSAEAVGRRSLKNTALSYLMTLDDTEVLERCMKQLEARHSMTDVMAALGCLTHIRGPERDTAFASFYDRWKDDALVTDKWFAMQAVSKRDDTLDVVTGLLDHPAFDMKNPNRCRALVGVFCMQNRVRFHEASGRGYTFLVDRILELDPINPQVAARLIRILAGWRRFDDGRQVLLKEQLNRAVASPGLSKDVFEVASKSLA